MDASPMAGWENFYVIIGSTAGGLTGLTFVIIALIRDFARVTSTGLHTFITPTIVHFGGVLAMAAFLSMPHQHVLTLSVGFAIAGLAGLTYTTFITVNMHRSRNAYVPVLEDWIWNVTLPAVVSCGLLIMAILIWERPALALFAVATLLLILLFIGIHNAWDIAVWMTTRKRDPP